MRRVAYGRPVGLSGISDAPSDTLNANTPYLYGMVDLFSETHPNNCPQINIHLECEI